MLNHLTRKEYEGKTWPKNPGWPSGDGVRILDVSSSCCAGEQITSFPICEVGGFDLEKCYGAFLQVIPYKRAIHKRHASTAALILMELKGPETTCPIPLPQNLLRYLCEPFDFLAASVLSEARVLKLGTTFSGKNEEHLKS